MLARRRVVLVALLLIAACSRKGAIATAEPSDASTVAVASMTSAPTLPVPPSPSPSAAGAARAVIEPPIFPTPPTPPGADPLHVEIASAICRAAKMKNEVGCRSHPPFTTQEQMPDGTLPEFNDPDPPTFCTIDKTYKGSFTAPGKNQVLVSFAPCRDDSAWDMANPGSGVVVEKTDGVHWRVIAYEPDVNLGGCKMSHLKRGDRDSLFCRSGISAGAGSMVYFFHLDFARLDKRKARTVAYIFDDEVHCGMMIPSPDSEVHLPGFAIADAKSFSVTDVNGDGTPDLVISVIRASLPASPSLDSKVKAMCKAAGRDMRPANAPLIPKSAMKPSKIEVVSSGDSFAPTPTAQRLLEEWENAANSGATQLKGAAPPALGSP